MRSFAFVLLTASVFFLSAPASAQSCDPGWTLCDGGCMPVGATCCYDGQNYCSSGVCCGDGTCSDSSSGCYGGSGGSGGYGGGGSCSPGEVACDGGCMPAGATCCNDGQSYCNSGVCCGDGTCSDSYSGCYGGSGGAGGYGGGGGSGGSATGGTGGGDAQCIRTSDTGADCSYVESCCDLYQCWYEADGASFPCDDHDCYEAARDVVDYCSDGSSSGSSDGSSNSGCTAAPRGSNPSSTGLLMAIGLALALAKLRRPRFARRR